MQASVVGEAAVHAYLGDVQHLGGGCSLLEEGSQARLPALIIQGVTLLPGHTLPLHVSFPRHLAVLRAAMAAPPPAQRLLVVINNASYQARPRRHPLSIVGCTAEIKQMRAETSNDGTTNGRNGSDLLELLDDEATTSVDVIARGRQRVILDLSDRISLHEQVRYISVKVLPEGNTDALPSDITNGYTAVHPCLARPWDLHYLSDLARRLCRTKMPDAIPDTTFAANSSALALSYVLAANLPLHSDTRQVLLECDTAADRLRLLISMLKELGRLACVMCGNVVINTSDSMAMTPEGAGGTFVNAHGHLHDLLTVAKLVSPNAVAYQGEPSSEFSWFPGYAWTICVCKRCGGHLGWRFSALSPSLQPQEFWGIRRDTLWEVISRTAAAGQPGAELVEAPDAEYALVALPLTPYAESSDDGRTSFGSDEEDSNEEQEVNEVIQEILQESDHDEASEEPEEREGDHDQEIMEDILQHPEHYVETGDVPYESYEALDNDQQRQEILQEPEDLDQVVAQDMQQQQQQHPEHDQQSEDVLYDASSNGQISQEGKEHTPDTDEEWMEPDDGLPEGTPEYNPEPD